jgi:Leucine-rich repeat (LRR) protein
MRIYIKYNIHDQKLIQFNSFDKIIDYNKVVYINCGFNQLSKLPELPNSLQILDCYCNNLSELPELPNSLQTLYCGNNKLIKKQKHKYLIKIIYI